MRGKDNTKAIPYLLPALVSILIVTCIPIIYTIVISFTNYNMYHLNDFTFIAFQNYLTVFSGSLKDVFFPVLGWTVCFAVLSTLGSYTMGLGLAILLNNQGIKGLQNHPDRSMGASLYHCDSGMAGAFERAVWRYQ